eukprot:SAG11_NODE_366_length_10128_cov_4.162030_6_plen_83_part_00
MVLSMDLLTGPMISLKILMNGRSESPSFNCGRRDMSIRTNRSAVGTSNDRRSYRHIQSKVFAESLTNVVDAAGTLQPSDVYD